MSTKERGAPTTRALASEARRHSSGSAPQHPVDRGHGWRRLGVGRDGVWRQAERHYRDGGGAGVCSRAGEVGRRRALVSSLGRLERPWAPPCLPSTRCAPSPCRPSRTDACAQSPTTATPTTCTQLTLKVLAHHLSQHLRIMQVTHQPPIQGRANGSLYGARPPGTGERERRGRWFWQGR